MPGSSTRTPSERCPQGLLDSGPARDTMPPVRHTMSDLRHPVRLKDIAIEAGVHFTTVSLVLRGRKGVSDAVRARVKAVADRLGYKPNPVLMALTSRRLNAHIPPRVQRMAFLSNHPGREIFDRNPHMRYFYEGAKEQAGVMGYACDLLFVGKGQLTARALQRQLDASSCEGVIIGAFNLPFRGFELDWTRFAAIKIDTRFMGPLVDFVSNDQMGAVRLAFRRLQELGYRRIGMAIGRYDEEATDRLYNAGCVIEQSSLPTEERIPPLLFGYRDRVSDAIPKLGAWARKHKVQVVLSNWAHIEEMALQAGFRVPDDLACVCLSLSDPNPLLAGVLQDHRAVGRKAAELLALTLKTGRRGPPEEPSSTYLTGSWQDGASAPGL